MLAEIFYHTGDILRTLDYKVTYSLTSVKLCKFEAPTSRYRPKIKIFPLKQRYRATPIMKAIRHRVSCSTMPNATSDLIQPPDSKCRVFADMSVALTLRCSLVGLGHAATFCSRGQRKHKQSCFCLLLHSDALSDLAADA